MKKIVFLILLFAAVALALYVTSRVNPNLFAEIKILGALLNATIFGVALIALAIGEKDVVHFPFLTASLLALFSGLVEGVLLFENRYYIAITAAAFVAFVFYLQIRHKRFSNKAYKNSADEGSRNDKGANLKDADFGGAKDAQEPQSKDAAADEILNFKSGNEISNSQSKDEILNSSGDLGENFASGAEENSDENFKISNGSAGEGGAGENSAQNFNQGAENSAPDARRDR
ncbi:MAG: hypothetical protein KH703_02645 [Campylobacter gracilis]|uniref:hypothetical protein n=1 Tax=Campylobacter gracilis TaxID=824 RepID=UPI0026F1CBE8|nr:hypothetical protein [Campylobacter gracilis]MBS6152300.1 hypothetical protein [Campylobacter gracilis]